MPRGTSTEDLQLFNGAGFSKMSVAVLPVGCAYPERFDQSRISLLTSSSDSDDCRTAPQQAQAPSAVPSECGGLEQVTDSDLRERIIKQIEWYFSDENLLKDSFLMKHINRNQQGYVSLKLVASLRKVKTITKDWKLVQESLKHSKLILNDEGTKVRRELPAPQVDFSHISKTLLITEYPNEEPNLADLEQQFGRYGEVSQIRMILPGRAVPLDIKPCKQQYSSLGKDLCVLVEFESEDYAKSAYQKIQKQQSWREGMKVQLLSENNSTVNNNEAMKDQEVVVKSEKKKQSKGKDSKLTEVQSQSARPEQSQYRDSFFQATSKHSSGKEYSPSPHSSPRSSPRSSREGTPTWQHRRTSPPSAGSSPHLRRSWNFQGNKCNPEPSHKHLRPDAWSNKDYSSDSGVGSKEPSPSGSSNRKSVLSKKLFSGSGSANDISWRSSDKQSRDTGIIRHPLGPDGSRGFRQKASPISITIHSS